MNEETDSGKKNLNFQDRLDVLLKMRLGDVARGKKGMLINSNLKA